MHHACQIIWQALLPPYEPPNGKFGSFIWFDIVQVDPYILISVRPVVGVFQTQAVQELMSDYSWINTAWSLKQAIEKHRWV